MSLKYWKLTAIAATALAVGCYAPGSRAVYAHGGGHGGGHEGGHEEHHEGEHHEGEHHEEHHEEHHDEHHTAEHHDDHHHDDHHWNHHDHNWHYANWGWGPGFWGGAALGYGLGNWGGWSYGGGSYVDNSDSGNTYKYSTPLADDGNDQPSNSEIANNDQNGQDENGSNPSKLPVDVWPELGISTFTGHNGDQSGLVVVKVTPGSAAAKAGLMAGDVILKFNGQPTPNDEVLEELLENAHGKFDLAVVDAQTDAKRDVTGTIAPANNETPAESNRG